MVRRGVPRGLVMRRRVHIGDSVALNLDFDSNSSAGLRDPGVIHCRVIGIDRTNSAWSAWSCCLTWHIALLPFLRPRALVLESAHGIQQKFIVSARTFGQDLIRLQPYAYEATIVNVFSAGEEDGSTIMYDHIAIGSLGFLE